MNIANKIKTIGTTLFVSSIIFFSNAQEVRTPGDFTGIKVGDSFDVTIIQSENNSVSIDASQEILSNIKTEIKDGILNIYSEGVIKTDKAIDIKIKSKNLKTVDVTGAADVKSENQLVCENILIETNGAGDIKLDIKAGEIKTNISGAGDVALSGSAALLNANVSGAGDLNATGLESQKVVAKVSGAGNAKVHAVQSLDADVSGAGSVIYKGNPIDRNVAISGAGSVRESKLGTGEETASDTTKFKLGNKKYMIIGDDEEGEGNGEYSYKNKKDSLRDFHEGFKNWAGWELGVNGLMDYKNSLELPASASFMELDYAKSMQFGLNLMEKDFHIYKNHVNLVVGFGFDFNHYAFKNNVTLDSDTSYLAATFDNIDYKKNRLNVSYIKAPLMLDFNTSKNENNNLHISLGVEFAYKIHSVAKQKYELNDVRVKTKNRDDFNMEPFRYSAMFRIGYNNVTLFANYGLNRLIQKNKGPQVYPFTLGVSFSFS